MAIVRWTVAEDRYLREIYPKYRNSSIAILMRRSKSAVLNRARNLGLHKGQELLDRIADQTRFKRGIVPPNKGKKRSECYSQNSIKRMEATQFKPGKKPLNYKGGRKFSGTLDQFNREREVESQCMAKYDKADKIIVAPIIEWSDNDVWDFINGNGIEYCKLYDEGWKRIGCLFCPMARKSEMRMCKERYPKYKEAIIRTIHHIRNKPIGGYVGDYP